MFFRSKGKGSAAPDPHLPALSIEQAEHLRDLVREYHSGRGIPVTVAGGTVTASQGTSSLYNLAEFCRRADPRAWSQLVEQRFNALDNAAQAPMETPDQILPRAYLRLAPDDALPPEAAASFQYARHVAPGLLETLALDLPDSVRLLDDKAVARVGLEQLRAAGRANLVKEPVEYEVTRTESGAELHIVSGESMFVASKALVLDDFYRSVAGRELPVEGALFTVPSRHYLAFHPIEDHHVVDAVNDLAAFGLGAHQDNPGPLSPRVYWWHKGVVSCLTHIDEATRSFSIVPPDELMDIMRRLHAQSAPAEEASPAAFPVRCSGIRATVDEDSVQTLITKTIEEIESLENSPQAIDTLWNALHVTVAARSAVDRRGSRLETWEAVVNTMQVGSALFRVTGASEGTVACRIHHEIRQLPAMGPRQFANAPNWLDAFWFAVICRDQKRMTELCEVPPDVLRASGAVHDEYLYHWVTTLQAYWSERPGDMVEALTQAFQQSHPDVARTAPRDWLQQISYPPINLFYRFIKRDHEGFNAALVEALEMHKGYWSQEDRAGDVSGLWAIGPLAIACLAYDGDFPIDIDAVADQLPIHLLKRSWLGEFDT
ncbi:immunity 49 family protein [Streptomyces sp. NPDC054841]